MKRIPHRPERIAALIQQHLALALQSMLKDPRVGFVTITSVRVSPDASHAHVRVSVLGGEDDKASAMEGLASARGFLRSHLAGALSLRSVPELHFHLDRGIEHAARINELLDESDEVGSD
jgi:ribosome-binding factor A